MFDFLIVGAGLYGATVARELTDAGNSVLVIDKRPQIAGNVYTEKIEGINVHVYGAHIFHTNNKTVWDYVNRFAVFNRFTNSPVANYKGELFSLPFNMYTFNKMWGVVTPEEAATKIAEQRKEISGEPKNLEEQYAKLCQLRRTEAEKLGFDSYIDMIYLSRHRFDYTAADIEKFRDAVAKYVVPAAVKIREAQRERLGVEKLEYYDESLLFPGGNSTPDKDTQGMIDAAQKMYRELSPETGEFFDFMVEHGLFDLETRAGKHLGGYCTQLMKYKAPFIFSNFNGSSADTEVLTHEAGHAFEGYVASRVQELMEYRHSTSEINEIHSMGMEFFTDPWYNLFYPEGEGDRYRFEHLSKSLEVITYLVSVDEFQHRVFEGEQPDAAGLRKIWKDIEQKYLPWRSYDGNEFLESGGFWMQKQHIFMYPFYYVDYALAAMCALQFFLRMRKDRDEAWSAYLKLCRLGGSLGYFDLLEAVGLNNPFREETVRDVVSGVQEVIDELEKAI